MALLTLSFVVAFLVIILLWLDVPGSVLSFYRKWRAVRNVPGLPTHWFWGNIHEVGPDEASQRRWTEYIQKTKYKMSRWWVGPFHPLIAVHHYDLVRKVLKEPKHHGTYRILLPWLGSGLLISEGHKWYRNRHLLTPAFHFEILKPYVTVYNNCLQVLLSKWSAAADRKEPVKLFDTISLLSLDIILQCAFSYKSDCQNVHTRHPYVKAVYGLIDLVAERFMNPLYRIDWIYSLSNSGKTMREYCKIVHEHSERVIYERRNALDRTEDGSLHTETTSRQQRYLDFLDVLLTAVDEDGNGLTDLEIRNEADTFMFEGHDTTTSGISWTLYCLAQYPEHQEKVREEVRNVLMGREWLEYDDLKELKYTQWVIKEAMRLYPPVFQIYRELAEDVELNGHLIPKGMHVTIAIRLIQRHPDIWENPNEFDPLRFHPSNVEGRDPLAYMPFSAGPRNCIGQNFAMNEERVVVASIVHRFRLSLVEDHRVEIVPKVVLRTKDDIKVNLEPLA